MKIKEIAAKKDKDLFTELTKLEDKLTKIRFEVATRETNKNDDIKKVKKDIARIKTILREREIGREEENNEKKA